MSCSRCESGNLRNCNCQPRVKVVTRITDSPCMGCTTQVDGTCVFFKSATTSCLGIKLGDRYDDIIRKLDAAICAITPVTPTNCCPDWVYTAPTLASGFSNAGSPYADVKYGTNTKEVELKGQVICDATIPLDTLTTVFTLPSGYIPAENKIYSYSFTGSSYVVIVEINILTTGEVKVNIKNPISFSGGNVVLGLLANAQFILIPFDGLRFIL